MTRSENIGAPGSGTVGKAMTVLDMVAESERPVRFTDLLEKSPYPKATLYRLLQTLTQEGLVLHNAVDQTYAPGIRLVRLAHAAWRQSSLAPIARPVLEDLSAEVEETIHLAQLDRGQVLYVDKLNAATPVEMFSQAGKTGPGYCTGVGKAMIAFLPENERSRAIRLQSFYAHTPNTITTSDALVAELEKIKERGIAFDREEHEPGIICIAHPILADNRAVIGALSITSTTQKHSLESLRAFEEKLKSTAARIAKDAQAWQFPSAK